jgi:hypothetical protein
MRFLISLLALLAPLSGALAMPDGECERALLPDDQHGSLFEDLLNRPVGMKPTETPVASPLEELIARPHTQKAMTLERLITATQELDTGILRDEDAAHFFEANHTSLLANWQQAFEDSNEKQLTQRATGLLSQLMTEPGVSGKVSPAFRRGIAFRLLDEIFLNRKENPATSDTDPGRFVPADIRRKIAANAQSAPGTFWVGLNEDISAGVWNRVLAEVQSQDTGLLGQPDAIAYLETHQEQIEVAWQTKVQESLGSYESTRDRVGEVMSFITRLVSEPGTRGALSVAFRQEIALRLMNEVFLTGDTRLNSAHERLLVAFQNAGALSHSVPFLEFFKAFQTGPWREVLASLQAEDTGHLTAEDARAFLATGESARRISRSVEGESCRAGRV